MKNLLKILEEKAYIILEPAFRGHVRDRDVIVTYSPRSFLKKCLNLKSKYKEINAVNFGYARFIVDRFK